MTLSTEPVGSIPRPKELIEGVAAFGAGRIGEDALEALYEAAVVDTIRSVEDTGISPRVETAAEVRDRILEAAKFIDLAQLGSTDDCGFSPFGDDLPTSRDTAFAKIRARVEGNAMASKELGI